MDLHIVQTHRYYNIFIIAISRQNYKSGFNHEKELHTFGLKFFFFFLNKSSNKNITLNVAITRINIVPSIFPEIGITV